MLTKNNDQFLQTEMLDSRAVATISLTGALTTTTSIDRAMNSQCTATASNTKPDLAAWPAEGDKEGGQVLNRGDHRNHPWRHCFPCSFPWRSNCGAPFSPGWQTTCTMQEEWHQGLNFLGLPLLSKQKGTWVPREMKYLIHCSEVATVVTRCDNTLLNTNFPDKAKENRVKDTLQTGESSDTRPFRRLQKST